MHVLRCLYSQLNPNRYRLNYVVDGQRTEGDYVLPPCVGAVPSGDYLEFVHATPEYSAVSSKFLLIHAAVAEVLHMIGAPTTIDQILRDWDSIQVLSGDGADAQLLHNRLQLIVV